LGSRWTTTLSLGGACNVKEVPLLPTGELIT